MFPAKRSETVGTLAIGLPTPLPGPESLQCAPNAKRIPLSLVRSATEYEITAVSEQPLSRGSATTPVISNHSPLTFEQHTFSSCDSPRVDAFQNIPQSSKDVRSLKRGDSKLVFTSRPDVEGREERTWIHIEPREICSIRFEMPKPGIGSRLSVLRISMSKVP